MTSNPGQSTTAAYIRAALRTKSEDFTLPPDRRTIDLIHAAIGLSTESGELLDAVKKFLFYGKPIDWTNVVEEFGDLFWYMAIGLHACGEEDFERVMRLNIQKLRTRYPEKFEKTMALFRDLDAERAVLEEQVQYGKVTVKKDGDLWCATLPDFQDLHSSIAGFGETHERAIRNLLTECERIEESSPEKQWVREALHEYYRGVWRNASPADSLRPNDRHGMIPAAITLSEIASEIAQIVCPNCNSRNVAEIVDDDASPPQIVHRRCLDCWHQIPTETENQDET